MLVTRILASLIATLTRTPGASRVRTLIAQAERVSVADPAVALAALEEAAALDGDNARIHSLIAEIHIQAERYDLAQQHLERSVALGATAQGLTQLGNVYQVRGDLSRAEATYFHALELDASAQLAHFNLAFLLRSQKRFAQALPHLRAAHESMPLRGAMLRTLVSALLEVSEFDEALGISEAITAVDPACVDAWLCLGLAHQKLHRSAQALVCYDRALELAPGDAEVFNNRAIALQYLCRWPEAFANYERALSHNPDYSLARFHRGLARLAHHRYQKGWLDYEARLLSVDSLAPPCSAPRWEGQSLAGRKVLVYGEQGLGDEIMFASCIPEVMGAAAQCVIECAPRLQGLFARSFPTAAVRPTGNENSKLADAEGFDFQVPIGNLPRHFRQSISDFPDHTGYLRPSPDRVAAWSRRLEALGPGLKVGLSWRGGTHKTRSPLRSMDLAALLPILKLPGIVFVSLQYTSEAAAEVNAFNARHGIEIRHWPEAIDDYEETAALMTALDLTVSVCTAVVHLGGALGRPVWVMAPTGAEWRYGHAGEAMPWYPSVRIFRQRHEGAWGEPIEALARRLETFTSAEAAKTVREAAHACNREGVEKLRAGDFRGARESFDTALAKMPYLAEAHSNLGIALLEQGLEGEGEQALREAIELDPGLLSARENLAVLLAGRYDHDAAVSAWDDVLVRDSRHANAHAARAFLALREGRFEEASVLRERALELGGDATALRMQEAAGLAMSGDTAGARALLGTLGPAADPHDLEWELALCDLYDSRFAQGWPLYEARLHRRYEASRRPYRYPEWDGQRVLEGSLLILGEQGTGDEIMFASCYREAITRAGNCIIECEPRLAALFARSFPESQVVGQPRHSANPRLLGRSDIAAQVYCGSLPKFFRTRADDFPQHAGYLEPDGRRVDEWRRRLSNEGRKRRVGIAWNGGLKHTRRSLRSVVPEVFAQILRVPEVEFVSLQHDDDGSVAAELARLSGARVHVFSEAFANFDELAALVASLDCVVTVCSTVVHLAGALGTPTLVLTPRHAEWRYLLEGPSMPWYPSVRLFRQARSGDWAPVIQDVRAVLGRALEPFSGVTAVDTGIHRLR